MTMALLDSDEVTAGVVDHEEEILAATDDAETHWLTDINEAERLEHRLWEIEKLESFGCFTPRARHEIPQ